MFLVTPGNEVLPAMAGKAVLPSCPKAGMLRRRQPRDGRGLRNLPPNVGSSSIAATDFTSINQHFWGCAMGFGCCARCLEDWWARCGLGLEEGFNPSWESDIKRNQQQNETEWKKILMALKCPTCHRTFTHAVSAVWLTLSFCLLLVSSHLPLLFPLSLPFYWEMSEFPLGTHHMLSSPTRLNVPWRSQLPRYCSPVHEST